jgi:hypothetical protein
MKVGFFILCLLAKMLKCKFSITWGNQHLFLLPETADIITVPLIGAPQLEQYPYHTLDDEVPYLAEIVFDLSDLNKLIIHFKVMKWPKAGGDLVLVKDIPVPMSTNEAQMCLNEINSIHRNQPQQNNGKFPANFMSAYGVSNHTKTLLNWASIEEVLRDGWHRPGQNNQIYQVYQKNRIGFKKQK